MARVIGFGDDHCLQCTVGTERPIIGPKAQVIQLKPSQPHYKGLRSERSKHGKCVGKECNEMNVWFENCRKYLKSLHRFCCENCRRIMRLWIIQWKTAIEKRLKENTQTIGWIARLLYVLPFNSYINFFTDFSSLSFLSFLSHYEYEYNEWFFSQKTPNRLRNVWTKSASKGSRR